MTVYKRYGDLKIDDVIYFHGAKLVIESISRSNAADGNKVVHFTVSPYNAQAVEILGRFYAYGTYGGNIDLPVEVCGSRTSLKQYLLYVDFAGEDCGACYDFATEAEAEQYANDYFTDCAYADWYIIDRYAGCEDFGE